MKQVKELDVVELLVDVPAAQVRRGAIGTVVAVFTAPAVAYEVEFADALGRTVVQLTLKPEEVCRRES
jgi:hypothetical protein